MTDPLFAGDDEANTPLTAEEREQLIPTYISLRAELNEAEQVNITQANRWLARLRKSDVLDDAFLRALHQRMFGDVWKWAGRFRTTGRNIGIDAYRIPTEVRQLANTTRYWVEHGTYEPDEIAIVLAICLSRSIHSPTEMADTLGWRPTYWLSNWSVLVSLGTHKSGGRRNHQENLRHRASNGRCGGDRAANGICPLMIGFDCAR